MRTAMNICRRLALFFSMPSPPVKRRLTDGLAYAFLGARIAQSIAHLISTSHTFVLVRFGFFIVQTIILIVWLLKLFHHI